MKKQLILVVIGFACVLSLTNCTFSKVVLNETPPQLATSERILNSAYSAPIWQSDFLKNYNPEDEVPERRDRFAKHFCVNDTSFTAILTAGRSLNYQDENGNWQTIDTRITKNNTANHTNFEYANFKNNFKSFYSNNINDGIIMELHNEIIKEGLNKKLVWMDDNHNIIETVDINRQEQIAINENKLTYTNILQNIDLQYTQQQDGRKMDYILQNRNALSNMPADAKYMAFAEDIELPKGWNMEININILDSNTNYIAVLNEAKKPIFNYKVPVHFDVNNEVIKSWYQLHKSTIYTMVPLSWLNDEKRVFPVKIDPTVNIVDIHNNDNGNNGTKYIYTHPSPLYPKEPQNASHTNEADELLLGGTYDDADIIGCAYYNVTSIASSWTVNKITLLNSGTKFNNRWWHPLKFMIPNPFTLDNEMIAICDARHQETGDYHDLSTTVNQNYAEWEKIYNSGQNEYVQFTRTGTTVENSTVPDDVDLGGNAVDDLVDCIDSSTPFGLVFLPISGWQSQALGAEFFYTTDGNVPISVEYSIPVALPISLKSFIGLCRNQGVLLQWEALTETNNDYFTLERGVSGIDWTEIAQIKGAGNSNGKLNYSYFDHTVNFNTSYYRLKQTDYNGDYEYFNPIVVSCHSITSDMDITIYPNPTDGKLNVIGTIDQYSITDLSGRTLMKSEKFLENQIDISALAKGTYFIHLHVGAQRVTKKVVKQ